MSVTICPLVTQETEDSRTLNYTHGRARYTLVQTREDFQDDSPGDDSQGAQVYTQEGSCCAGSIPPPPSSNSQPVSLGGVRGQAACAHSQTSQPRHLSSNRSHHGPSFREH